MGMRKRRFGAITAAMALVLGGVVAGSTPASAATLNQQWIVQPWTLPGSAPDSVGFANGSTLDAGLENVQVNSTFPGQSTPQGFETADVERFQLLNGVSLSDVETELALATGGNPAQAGPAMAWFDTNTRFFSGASVMEHARFTIVQNGGSYYAAQIWPTRVQATAKQFVINGTTTATLPAVSQVLTMQSNDTFAVSVGGSIPKIKRTTLRVTNASGELHFARFMPVSSTTTISQATSWCANPAGPSPVTGNPPLGIGTMSGGVSINYDLSTYPAGRYIVIDGLPDATTGQSHISTMCKVVDLV